jgi:hypothetical protein
MGLDVEEYVLPLFFEMEMKGLVKAVAGGCYRAVMM